MNINLQQNQKKWGWSEGLPDMLYDLIFDLLPGKSLIACRRVCRNWKSYCTPLLYDKTHIRFKPSKPLWIFKPPLKSNFNTDVRRLSWLNENSVWILEWPDVKFDKIKDSYFRKILTILRPGVANSVFANIGSLELSSCTLSWKSFRLLQSLLPNLKDFTDSKSLIDFASGDDSGRSCFPKWKRVWDILCEERLDFQFFFNQLKISRKNLGLPFLLYLHQLWKFSQKLEEIEINLRTGRLPEISFESESSDLFFYLSHSVAELLKKHSKTLKRVSLWWEESFGYRLIVELYLAFSGWGQFFTDDAYDNPTTIPLAHLSIHVRYIDTKDGYFLEFIAPFISKLDNLETLSIGKILMDPDAPGVVSLARPDPRRNVDISLQVIFKDNVNPEVNQWTISSIWQFQNLFQEIVEMRVKLSTKSQTERLSQVLPLEDDMIFPNVKDMYIHSVWKGTLSKFDDFCIEGLCKTYPNLSNLEINDRADIYCKLRVSDCAQIDGAEGMLSRSARMGDAEIQMLIRSLTKLKELKLRLRMDTMTDVGMTGRPSSSQTLCNCKKQVLDDSDLENKVVDNTYLDWKSFSNLTHLEVCHLKGLSDKITDRTALEAFNHLPKLKSLKLCGRTSISSLGKKFLQKLLPESKGCVLRIS